MIRNPFPSTFIYEFSIDPVLVDNALKDLLAEETYAISAIQNEVSVPAKSLYHKNSEISYKPVYQKELFDEIQKHVDSVCDTHFSNSKLAICDSWLTQTQFGQNSSMHPHSFSIFSGLLYLSDHSNSTTYFELDDPFYEKYKILFGPALKHNIYTYNSPPVKGKLLLWDSSIRHKITTHKERTTRYTLAFNTWLSGELGTLPTAKLTSHVVDVSKPV